MKNISYSKHTKNDFFLTKVAVVFLEIASKLMENSRRHLSSRYDSLEKKNGQPRKLKKKNLNIHFWRAEFLRNA